MNKSRPTSAKQEQELMAHIFSPEIAEDPYAFVLFIFPWGQKGTPLENEPGPRAWQKKKLLELRDHIQKNKNADMMGKALEMLQDATKSGRGIGKSALVSWLVLWMLSTKLGSTTIVTANTEDQLKTKTWAELGVWHTLAINSHWFEKAALSLTPMPWFCDLIEKQLKIDRVYYYARAILWSKENPDAFAGAHNPKGMLLVFDEASGIPEAIWKVSKGFFTEKKSLYRLWFAFGNPRRNTGSFFECFHKNRDFWRNTTVDARTVEGTDPQIYEQIIKEHGADSYDAKVEVYGEFPNQGEKQFISRDLVTGAKERVIEDGDQWAPLIMGVDPARFGDDKTVIRFRQGRNARVLPPIKLAKMDNMVVANECARLITLYNPDAVCIDAGNGTGIIDRLREMKYKVTEVWFGASSPKAEWANNRTYLWAEMRSWLGGGCIDEDPHLTTDLAAPEYKFMGTSDKIRLETKEEMKARGFDSPDDGDALACTFAVKVARLDLKTARGGLHSNARQVKDMDFSLLGD